MAAPPKTPAPIIAKLNSALNETLKMPEMKEQYKKLGLDVRGGTPEDMAKVMKDDTERWGAVIKAANIPHSERVAPQAHVWRLPILVAYNKP